MIRVNFSHHYEEAFEHAQMSEKDPKKGGA